MIINTDDNNAVGTKYGVRGIPTFIILDGTDASILDSNGRSTVSNAKGDTAKALAAWVIK